MMLQSTKRNNNFLPQLRTSKIYSTRKQLNQRLRSESSLETCLIRNETAAGVIFFFICAIDCTGSLDITNSGVGLGFYSRPRLRNGQPYQKVVRHAPRPEDLIDGKMACSSIQILEEKTVGLWGKGQIYAGELGRAKTRDYESSFFQGSVFSVLQRTPFSRTSIKVCL